MNPRHAYVHVPFCARRCSYCDFAIAARRTVPDERFVSAVERELAVRWGGNAVPAGGGDPPATLDTLYLGGGTPSRLGPGAIARLVRAIGARWPLAENAEVTIEANPEDLSPASARAWRAAGVTRVSLGIQSFDDEVLRWMHRTHDAAQAVRAAGVLRDAGFDDWSLDLIFALPPEVARSWTADLQRAVDLGPAHVSCYGLTVEPHTPLLRWRERGVVHDADEVRYEEEFLEADERLADAGYEHYEVSNYAWAGRRSRHNSAYWKRVPYAGLGPSAHEFDGLTRRWNAREYVAWQALVESGSDPVAGSEMPDETAVTVETSYLALRTSSGLPLTPQNRADFERWRAQGWAVSEGESFRLTPIGWLRLDSLVGDLTGVRSR